MWRITAFLKRSANIDREPFLSHLKDVWAPAITSQAGHKNVLKKLFINLPMDLTGTALEEVFPPHFDALIELYYDDYDSALQGLSSLSQPVANARLDSWVDQSASSAFLGDVRPKKPEDRAATGVRMTVAGQVVDGMTVEDAQHYWNDVHPVVAQRAPDTWSRLTLYTQVHGRKISGEGLAEWLCPYQFFPMCADMGATSIDEMLIAYGNDQYMSIVRPDEQKFSKPAEMLTFVTDRKVTVLDRV